MAGMDDDLLVDRTVRPACRAERRGAAALRRARPAAAGRDRRVHRLPALPARASSRCADDRAPARAGGPARGDPRRPRRGRPGRAGAAARRPSRPDRGADLSTPTRPAPRAGRHRTEGAHRDEATRSARARPGDPPRARASALFNHTWTLLEKPDRTPAAGRRDDPRARMPRAITGARSATTSTSPAASGSASRVYAVLGRGEPALWHARRCVEIAEADAEAARTGTCRPPTRRWPGRQLVAGDAAAAARRGRRKAVEALASDRRRRTTARSSSRTSRRLP